MTALAINDLSISNEMDLDSLGSIVGGYLTSRWVGQGISTGNFGAWRITKFVNMGFHKWNGKYYKVYNEHQARSRTQTERRYRSRWYD